MYEYSVYSVEDVEEIGRKRLARPLSCVLRVCCVRGSSVANSAPAGGLVAKLQSDETGLAFSTVLGVFLEKLPERIVMQ